MTKEERREYNRKWYLKNKEKCLEQKKQYYQANKERIKEYRQDNREKRLEWQKEYYQANREKVLEHQKGHKKDYYNTPIGRASYLVNAYNRKDKEYNRGKGDLTAEWIVENIFTQPCKHCGKTGWDVIGCNRIDNSKPHTKDNVEPCCFECNIRLPRK